MHFIISRTVYPVYIYIRIYIYMYVCMYACMHVCMYVISVLYDMYHISISMWLTKGKSSNCSIFGRSLLFSPDQKKMQLLDVQVCIVSTCYISHNITVGTTRGVKCLQTWWPVVAPWVLVRRAGARFGSSFMVDRGLLPMENAPFLNRWINELSMTMFNS